MDTAVQSNPDNGGSGRDGGSTANVARVKAWFRYWRIKVAHAVLLPELDAKQAHDLRVQVHQDGKLTSGYVLMCALSAGIAILGLLQSSTAVVIGAMLISPLMSPIAALGFAFSSFEGKRIREAARVVMIGAAIGILTGILLTWISPIRNATPEILARTQPTLLDLAIALFSGIAGGYATVIGKGGTAIGVAIATALMPPLATIGYGIGVLEPTFALGALLLFLTNLAAIAIAFAVIARLSGAAKPLHRVEWTPKYIFSIVTAALALGVPLSMTLVQITHEARLRTLAKAEIEKVCGGAVARVAQLDVKWPLFGEAQVDALVISPTYTANAGALAQKAIARQMNDGVTVNLQQVQAADLQSQTRALVDAALERTVAGLASDVPPITKIRQNFGLPTRSVWVDRAQRTVFIEPVNAPEWTLADYRTAESQADKISEGWAVRVVPPVQSVLRVRLAGDPPAEQGRGPELLSADVVVWALQRWGMSRVTLSAPDSDGATALKAAMDEGGILFLPSRNPPPTGNEALISVYAPSPTQVAEASARAEAEKERAEAEKKRVEAEKAKAAASESASAGQ